MSIIRLFLIFVKIGAILLGGGYVILPIMESEFAEKRNLISKDDIISYFALSQSLPGIIAANMSMFIGYKLRGKSGALVAMFGVIFVPFWAIVLISSAIVTLINNRLVQGAFWGVSVAVIALIILTARDMWKNSAKTVYFYVMFASALIALIFLNLSPIKTILLFTILGVVFKRLRGDKV